MKKTVIIFAMISGMFLTSCSSGTESTTATMTDSTETTVDTTVTTVDTLTAVDTTVVSQ